MAVNYKLKLNMDAIARLERHKKSALYKSMDALKTDLIASQTMPYDSGTMQNTSTHVARSQNGQVVSLITRTPYAARMYFHPEYNFQTVNNPHAQGRWLDIYLTGSKKDFLKDQFVAFFRQETGQ